MALQEIGEFLSQFNSNSYNRSQIGNDKQLVIRIYEYLDKVNLSKEDKDILITNISYLRKDNLNMPLFLEILTRSLGYTEEYTLSKVIKVVKEVHDTYLTCVNDLSMEEYVHLAEENHFKKLFIPYKHKLLNEIYLNDLRFSSAIAFPNKEYNDFMSSLESNHETLLVFNKYITLRDTLNKGARLYWDIYFGIEYLFILNKINIPYSDIFSKTKSSKNTKVELEEPIQLDIFNYEEPECVCLSLNNISVFQLDHIYKTSNIPDIDKEQELIDYYNNIIKRNKYVTLPKLKGKQSSKYIFLNK